mmetsp:Transcript_82782/g.146221  ORF Transcript_82782/g.146221 Transcript_82782/m.146221 type:complete len:574 (+) Transcript_82782:115-1836(+)
MAHFRRVAVWPQVMWLSILFLPAASAVVARAIDQKTDVDVNYVAEMLDKLKVFVQQQTVATQEHFGSEITRLRGAINSVNGSGKVALEETLSKVETERIEAEAASLEALQYYHTVRAAMGSTGGAPSCDFLSCGRHASCRVRDNGRAFCECASCFAGDGFTCRPSACMPDTFYSAQLIKPKATDDAENETLTVSEISLTSLDEEHVLVAVRDEQQGDRGFLMLGKIGAKDITWGEKQAFSGELKAFAPVITGFANGRFLVSFRDQETDGIGYLVSGQVESDELTGVKVVMGMAHGFVKHQEQKMVLVPLSSSKVVCLYADHILDEHGLEHQRSGGAAVVQVLAEGALSLLGKYHFAMGGKLQHIAATRLTESEFMVTYRSLPQDADDAGKKSKELAVAWMKVSKDDLLVINPHPLFLERDTPGILQRDVALVSQNLIALSFYSSHEKKTKTTLVRWDPSTQHIKQVGTPTTIGGFASYVGSISLPGGTAVPSTFTYFQPEDAHGVAEVCGVSPVGDLSGCKDLSWTEDELRTASGIRLQDGRLLFAFANSGGTASTRFMSAEEASAQDVATVV